MNALNFDSYQIGVSKFEFVLHSEKKEIVTGDDTQIKFFDTIEKQIKDECQDVSSEVGVMNLGCGLLAIGQGKEVYIISIQEINDFDGNKKFMTNFNSNVRLLVFNEKRKLLIACAEDDDFVIINLDSLNILKYKSMNEGSLKCLLVSQDGKFLLTTGCDGYICVYDFLEGEGMIKPKKKIFFNKKVAFDSSQNLAIDINNTNICAIGGNPTLRTLFLDSNLSGDDLAIIHEKSIHSSSDINFLKWVDSNKLNESQLIIIIDTSNLIKVYNYAMKTCLFNTNFNSEILIRSLQISLSDSNSNFQIYFSDSEGNINISQVLTNCFEEQKQNPYKAVKKYEMQDDNQLEANLEECIGQVDLENIISDESNKLTNKNEDVHLSDLEDEEGNVRSKEERERLKLEREAAEKKEAFSDEIIGTLPQQAIISNSTELNEKLNKTSCYLCWNMIGQIIKRNETYKSIEIIFSDLTNKNKISFVDVNDYVIAVMNNCGALFANKIDEENEDEYEKDDARQVACLEFKTISSNSMLKDWRLNLPAKENPTCLAIGINWCGVYSNSNMFLRLFTLYGTERMVISMPCVVAMAGYEDNLAIVYHAAVPLLGNQQMRLKILDASKFFQEIYDGILPLSPESTLCLFNYSEEGILITLDSKKIIRGFFYGVFNIWIPLLDFERTTENKNFWVIGMQDEEIYGIELKGFMNEPQVGSRLPTKSIKIKMPLISDYSGDNQTSTSNPENIPELEQQLFKLRVFITHDEYRYKNYYTLKEVRNFRSPEFYYSDNIRDESDLKKRKIEHDKTAITLMTQYIYSGHSERIIGLFETLMIPKSRQQVIKLCQYQNMKEIENILNEKMLLLQIRENNNRDENLNGFLPSKANQQVLSYDFDSPFKPRTAKNGSKVEPKSSFAELAIPLDNMKSIEEEVRNELGLENDEDGLNSLKASINLEKKNVNNHFILE
jgi:WD40 repeat protein